MNDQDRSLAQETAPYDPANWEQVAERMRQALCAAENAMNAVYPMVSIAALGDLTEEQLKTFRIRSAVFNVARQVVKEATTYRAIATRTPAEGEHDPVAFRERLIQDLEAENDRLRAQVENARALYEAADRVCWFDWSDNDRDAAHAIEDLRGALRRASALSHTSTNGQPNG